MTENPSPLKINSAKKNKSRLWVYFMGLVLGIIFGVAYAWLVDPVMYPHSLPADLHPAEKAIYRSLVAQVYAATGSITRAEMRLAVLEDDDPVQTVSSQAQRALADGNTSEAYALALLASGLYQPNEPATSPAETAIPTDTKTPQIEQVPTNTLPIPTMTP